MDVVRSILAFVAAPVSSLVSALVSALASALASLATSSTWSGALAGCKAAVRWLSAHTGVPALLVAAVLIAVGYRLLKRSARFAVEVAAVTLALVLASHLGWLRW